MREPRPDWSPLGVNFKNLDEHPYLFCISSPPPPGFAVFARSKEITRGNFSVSVIQFCKENVMLIQFFKLIDVPLEDRRAKQNVCSV